MLKGTNFESVNAVIQKVMETMALPTENDSQHCFDLSGKSVWESVGMVAGYIKGVNTKIVKE